MKDNSSDSLDKWLQKNIASNSKTSQDKSSKFFQKLTQKLTSSKNTDNKSQQSTASNKQKPEVVAKRTQNIKNTRSLRPRTQNKNTTKPKPQAPRRSNKAPVLKMIPLGGLNEVGQNMMAIEYDQDIIIIDMGLQFPNEDMFGIDYIVPDISYLKNNLHKIRGVIITHGHLDHIGGISYIAPHLNNPPFFSLRLTNGLIEKQIKEHSSCKNLKLVTVKPKQKFKLGTFTIQFFRVNHSIPDSCGLIIETPEGLVIHTGDFKFDKTPADNTPADYQTLKWLGTQNVLALFSDSTNAMRPGETMSEKYVQEALESIVSQAQGRVVIASFSSLIGRMQQVLDIAQKYKRKVYISGRSMVDNIMIATKLGYLKYPKDLIKPLNRARKEARNKNSLILTTGSQGERMSALTRMAFDEHKDLKLNQNDTVVFSSNTIVGNERAIIDVVNKLAKKGATVINNQIMDVHTTGHGYQEDLKAMCMFVKPKYLIPVHGEIYMRKAHKDLMIKERFPEKNILMIENGNILEAKKGELIISKETVPSNQILVDNQTSSLSTITPDIISERKSLAENGIIIISGYYSSKHKKLSNVNIQSLGFLFGDKNEKVTKELQDVILKTATKFLTNRKKNFLIEELAADIKFAVSKHLSFTIERLPLVSILINQ